MVKADWARVNHVAFRAALTTFAALAALAAFAALTTFATLTILTIAAANFPRFAS